MKKCGIYTIVNTTNNKLYIGSSKDIVSRWYAHRNGLENNLHHNKHLQRAWNKYGSNCFKFDILTLCDEDLLLTEESFYVGKYKTSELYNIAEVGRNSPNPKKYSFLSPSGEILFIKNLTRFCQENNLSKGNMHSVYTGKRISHKGYKAINSRDKKDRLDHRQYDLISPEGIRHTGSNLHKLCVDHDLQFQNMYKVINKERATHSGWRLYDR